MPVRRNELPESLKSILTPTTMEDMIEDTLLNNVLLGVKAVDNLKRFLVCLSPEVHHPIEASKWASHMMKVIRTRIKGRDELNEALIAVLTWVKMLNAIIFIRPEDYEGYPECQETILMFRNIRSLEDLKGGDDFDGYE